MEEEEEEKRKKVNKQIQKLYFNCISVNSCQNEWQPDWQVRRQARVPLTATLFAVVGRFTASVRIRH